MSRKNHYYGGSTIINPTADARSAGKWVEDTYCFARDKVIDKLIEGTLHIRPIYNRKLRKEINSFTSVKEWALAQPEFGPRPLTETPSDIPPLPPVRKPPRNRSRR
jgi:hypothetical protein